MLPLLIANQCKWSHRGLLALNSVLVDDFQPGYAESLLVDLQSRNFGTLESVVASKLLYRLWHVDTHSVTTNMPSTSTSLLHRLVDC